MRPFRLRLFMLVQKTSVIGRRGLDREASEAFFDSREVRVGAGFELADSSEKILFCDSAFAESQSNVLDRQSNMHIRRPGGVSSSKE